MCSSKTKTNGGENNFTVICQQRVQIVFGG